MRASAGWCGGGRRAGAGAFSLAELVVVMAVLAALAAAAAPAARRHDQGRQAQEAALTLAARLRAAGDLAVRLDRPVRLRIDRRRRRYLLEVASDGPGSPFQPAGGTLGQAVALPPAADFGALQADGGPETDTLCLAPQRAWPAARLWLVAGAEACCVRCRPGGGRVTVHRQIAPGVLEPPEPSDHEDLLRHPL